MAAMGILRQPRHRRVVCCRVRERTVAPATATGKDAPTPDIRVEPAPIRWAIPINPKNAEVVTRADQDMILVRGPTKVPQMSLTPDSTLADQIIAELKRELAACKTEREEALARETA